jgi:hypothetical protein
MGKYPWKTYEKSKIHKGETIATLTDVNQVIKKFNNQLPKTLHKFVLHEIFYNNGMVFATYQERHRHTGQFIQINYNLDTNIYKVVANFAPKPQEVYVTSSFDEAIKAMRIAMGKA